MPDILAGKRDLKLNIFEELKVLTIGVEKLAICQLGMEKGLWQGLEQGIGQGGGGPASAELLAALARAIHGRQRNPIRA